MNNSPAEHPVAAADVNEVLYEVISDVLEQFAFMFASPITSDRVKLHALPMWRAEIHFAGPFSGHLSLCASGPFCMLLATNVLGMEVDELSPEHARDALKELTNITCGELLAALAGKKHVFDLSVPVIEKIDAAAVKSDLALPGTVSVLIDDEPLFLSVGLTAS